MVLNDDYLTKDILLLCSTEKLCDLVSQKICHTTRGAALKTSTGVPILWFLNDSVIYVCQPNNDSREHVINVVGSEIVLVYCNPPVEICIKRIHQSLCRIRRQQN